MNYDRLSSWKWNIALYPLDSNNHLTVHDVSAYFWRVWLQKQIACCCHQLPTPRSRPYTIGTYMLDKATFLIKIQLSIVTLITLHYSLSSRLWNIFLAIQCHTTSDVSSLTDDITPTKTPDLWDKLNIALPVYDSFVFMGLLFQLSNRISSGWPWTVSLLSETNHPITLIHSHFCITTSL